LVVKEISRNNLIVCQKKRQKNCADSNRATSWAEPMAAAAFMYAAVATGSIPEELADVQESM